MEYLPGFGGFQPNALYKTVLVENTGLNHNSHVEVTAAYNSSGTMDKLHGLFLVSSVIMIKRTRQVKL